MGIKEEEEEDESLRTPQDQAVKQVEVVETDDGQRQSFVQDDAEGQGNEFAQMENEFQGFSNEHIGGGDIIVQETDDLGMVNDPTSQPGSFVGIPEDNNIDQEYRSNSDHDSLNNDIDINDVKLTDGITNPANAKPSIPVAPLPV